LPPIRDRIVPTLKCLGFALVSTGIFVKLSHFSYGWTISPEFVSMSLVQRLVRMSVVGISLLSHKMKVSLLGKSSTQPGNSVKVLAFSLVSDFVWTRIRQSMIA
jgi:hypothetical protein